VSRAAGGRIAAFSGWARVWWSRVVAGGALAVVAGVTGRISYAHIEALTLALHQSPMVARLMPFGVDGLIVVGSVILLQAVPGQERLGWLGVAPGVAASLFANVESGIRYGWLSATWAGVPAAAFALACFLFERWLYGQVGQGGRSGQGDQKDVVSSDQQDSSSDADACPHHLALTAEEAAVQAFLHARECLSDALSQRQLAASFGLSRQRVAELVGPLNGHHVPDVPVTEIA
jgi:hypothetical protein